MYKVCVRYPNQSHVALDFCGLFAAFNLTQQRLLRALRGEVVGQVLDQHTRRHSGSGPLPNHLFSNHF